MTLFGYEVTGYQAAFIIIAGITLFSSAMVVLMPNILRGALFLGLALCGIAGLYTLLNAPFLAVVQMLVYVGGITMMIVLAIFLTHRFMNVKIFDAIYNPLFGAAVAGVTFLFLFLTVVMSVWIKPNVANGPAVEGAQIGNLADALLQTYVFPFELITLLLIAVVVGAIVLAKEDKDNGNQS